jgi:hypothetical protein
MSAGLLADLEFYERKYEDRVGVQNFATDYTK